jgi:hypothetical protein
VNGDLVASIAERERVVTDVVEGRRVGLLDPLSKNGTRGGGITEREANRNAFAQIIRSFRLFPQRRFSAQMSPSPSRI